MLSIYKITNTLNGKIYIGKTSRDITVRFREHISSAKLGTGFALSNAINKYGSESFTIELVEQLSDDLFEMLSEREIYWINNYKSTTSALGYNITSGGEGADPHTVVITDGLKSYRIDKAEFDLNRDQYETKSDGMVTCFDMDTCEYIQIPQDLYISNKDRYKFSCVGLVTVFDDQGNSFKVTSEEYNDGDYKTNSSGKVYAIDEFGSSVTLTCSEYQQNKHLYTKQSSGIVYARIKATGQRINISTGEYRENSDIYETANSNKTFVIDRQHNCRVRINPEDFDDVKHMKIAEYNKTNNVGKRPNATSTNMVTVLNSDDEYVTIDVSEYKQNKHLYRRPSEGFVYVILKSTGEKVKVTKEEYKTNKHLYNTASSGRIAVFCTVENRKRKIPKEEFNPQIHIVKPKYKYKKK